MRIKGVEIEDTFAEAFRMWATRLIVTAIDRRWVDQAVRQVCGYGTSVIGCDAEAGLELALAPEQTPDGRPGAAVMFYAFNAKALAKMLPNRVGQCLMTCPTTAVYDGMPELSPADHSGPGESGQDAASGQDETSTRLEMGSKLRFFGDGYQKSKVIEFGQGARRFWRVPVMDGEFTVEESAGASKAIGGGNILIGGSDQRKALDAAMRAVDAVASLPKVITPFPGGVVRSGSKVGSRYKALFASTNEAFCPTLRGQVDSQLNDQINCVYEIVINGLDELSISAAMRTAIEAAIGDKGVDDGVVLISAGNYGGNLGKFHFKLHEVMAGPSR